MFNVNWGTPVVSSGSFSTLGFNSMTLHGQVTAKGSPTSYHFEYGTTTGYGSAAPAPDASAGSGMTPVPVSQPISGLTPGTTYHFRLVATNENGTIASPDATFICTGETPGGPRLGVPHLAPGH
jgi:hypothetical protein